MNPEELKLRIFNTLPAASYNMDRLISLLDIVESDRIETACVECTIRPRMLLNPDFIREHCRNDEHLFLLVMHELYHVILGHTRLFQRPDATSNIVFDAIINSILSHEFPEPEYISFFQDLNPWDSFPSRLLRPPPGWPDQEWEPFPEEASPAEQKAIELLYGSQHETTTYHDVYEALLTDTISVKVKSDDGGNAPGDSDESILGNATLLGNHEGENLGPGDGDLSGNDASLREILQDIIEKWPPPSRPIAGRDLGRNAADFLLNAGESPKSRFLKALKRLLTKAGFYDKGSRSPRRPTIEQASRTISTPIPQVRDRRAAGYRILHGRPPFLYQGTGQHPRHRRIPRNVAHAYLDVSGSMGDTVELLCSALKPFHRREEVRLHVFSTVVDELDPKKPINQLLANTWGTDIQCVINHVLSLPPGKIPRRVLVFTDGFTGIPDHASWKEFKKRGAQLHVGIIEEGSLEDLQPYATHIETLPGL